MKIFDRINFFVYFIPMLFSALVISGCALPNGITKTYPAAEDFDVVSMDNAKKIKVHLWSGRRPDILTTTTTTTTTTTNEEITAIEPEISELIAEVWCVTKKTIDYRDTGPQACKYITLIESSQDKKNDINGVTEFFKACDDEAKSPPICRTARNRLHSYLMKISKKNCSTYLQDIFTVRTAADGATGFIKDILSGGAVAQSTQVKLCGSD